ncbi:hypothetical protein [Hymenobacter chitinivorans]|uniref:Uncharacterized protein n=1 Tax=Hymenobacter chitinivorans DSM 11115 TaxID=1121954 RepID=A0A2M9BQS0_9BACT|nr:hypothetical protein [Hymenobacter chitinivorans]PJJ60285.1 hypothetical protein CLV45_1710 [Hymenobacter chitinivorans DSM 11115]
MLKATAAVARVWTKALLATLGACLIISVLTLATKSNLGADVFLVLLAGVAGIAAFVWLTQAVMISVSAKQRPSYAVLGCMLAALAATGCSAFYAQGLFYGQEVLSATFLITRNGRRDLALY